MSRRQLQNIAYRQVATAALLNSPDPNAFKWMVDFEEMRKHGATQRGRGACWRPGILSELGRLQNPDQIREIAQQLCEMMPKPNTTREAVAILRVVRGSLR